MKPPSPAPRAPAALAVLAAACLAACSARPSEPRAPADGGWVSPAKVDTRELTVLIKVEPPAKLRALFETMAQRAGDDAVASFFLGHSAGSYGSGFIVARRASPRPMVFVVTNRHVVDLAERVTIVLESGEAYADAEIVYVDRRYDLAVLAFPEARPVPVAYGFPLASEPVRDQQVVTATGFPALAGRPSYRTTRGYVSNERFELDDEAGETRRFIQHTAPIGPGSSGGPLTTEGGRLVGVNTLKILDSDSAYVAVPAVAVADAVGAAVELRSRRAHDGWRRRALGDACRSLVAELGSDEPRPNRLEGAIASTMVGERGAESFSYVAGRDEELWELFRTDPVDAIRWSIVRRLWGEVRAGGGVRAARSCEGAGDGAAAAAG
ncbi:MAG TPA: serine protease, partial [Polyangiaceae bacterium]|nr:serine protease [Polyangiaceae bacterium]